MQSSDQLTWQEADQMVHFGGMGNFVLLCQLRHKEQAVVIGSHQHVLPDALHCFDVAPAFDGLRYIVSLPCQSIKLRFRVRYGGEGATTREIKNSVPLQVRFRVGTLLHAVNHEAQTIQG